MGGDRWRRERRWSGHSANVDRQAIVESRTSSSTHPDRVGARCVERTAYCSSGGWRRRGRMVESIAASCRAWPRPAICHVRQMQRTAPSEMRRGDLARPLLTAFGCWRCPDAVGLYGVISYSVAQRMHELGVATAPREASRHRLRVGHVVGAVGSCSRALSFASSALWPPADSLEPLLFRVSPRDPIVFGLVALVLIVVALVASVAPAVRANPRPTRDGARGE